MTNILEYLKGLLHGPEKTERDKWGTNMEYYLCSLGFAVGFGSLWRFPYLVYANGGGAFLIPYCFFVIVLCFPLLYLETAIGQTFQTSVTGCFAKISKKFKGIGISEVICTFFMGCYYNLLLAYSIVFLWKSFSWPLPWKVDSTDSQGKLWNDDYFKDEVLHLTPDASDLGGINTPLLTANAASFIICFLCVAKGLGTTGKVAYITVPAPYFFLFVFLIRGFFLDGAWEGISFLFKVDFSKLWDLSTWFRAANQVLFQYSISSGTMFAFSSYKERNQSLKKPAIIIPAITGATGILCAFTVFTYMGHMAKVAGVPISELPLAGPDLVFVAYPAALTLMPGATLWAIAFFVMLFFLGVDTQFAFLETLAGYVEDEKIKIFGKEIRIEAGRIMITVALFVVGFILNFDGGFHFLALYDDYSTIVPLMLSALLECVVFGWIYGTQNLDALVYKYTGERFPKYATICLKYVVIPLLAFLIINSFYTLAFVQIQQYPWWAGAIGLFLMVLPIFVIVYYYYKHKDDQNRPSENQQWIEMTQPMNNFASY